MVTVRLVYLRRDVVWGRIYFYSLFKTFADSPQFTNTKQCFLFFKKSLSLTQRDNLNVEWDHHNCAPHKVIPYIRQKYCFILLLTLKRCFIYSHPMLICIEQAIFDVDMDQMASTNTIKNLFLHTKQCNHTHTYSYTRVFIFKQS